MTKLFRRGWRSSWHARTLTLTAGLGAALVGGTLWQNGRALPPPSNRPLEVPAAGYVSSDACRSCHPGNYASWHASFHRTMTQPATPANVIPHLDGLELSLDGALHRVERRGEAFFARVRAAGAAPEEFGPAREIVLLTGSHHQQNYWLATSTGRGLEPFPFGWLVAEKMWAPLDDTFLGPPDGRNGRAVTGTWNNGCQHCHTTNGRARGLRDHTFDTQVSEFGVSCEACHGEGREHIARQSNPLTRYLAHLSDAADPTITNPARLSGPASALACGQCHSMWAFASAEAETANNQFGGKFRPGQPALPDRFVAQPTTSDHLEQKQALQAGNPHFFTDSFWSDGMIRVTGREYNGVELSPCFKGGNFSCLSCHEMHPDRTDRASLQTWAASQMKSGATSDRACLQCHGKMATNLAAHTHHAPESAGSRCYDCHMPHTSFGLLRAVRSHQVSSPSVEETLRTGRPNACNLCHLDRPLQWTAVELHRWFGQPMPIIPRDGHEIAAGAQWLLQGDAGQRALVAWSMGWPPAQQAAGRDWFAPYLAITLNDPYAAVRHVAGKSLRTLPGFEDFTFVYTESDQATFARAGQAYQHSLQQWQGKAPRFPPATLLDAGGRFEPATYQRLLDARDHRRIYLVE